jgi:hypothetical protein
MQGIFIRGQRAATKAALKSAAAVAPGHVRLEATSIVGNEYDGRLSEAPAGKYYVVGPDPYTSRKWYAQIIVGASGIKVK